MAHELVHTLQQHSGSQRSAGSDLPGNRRAAVCSRSAGMWQRAQTGRPASTSPFFTYELDSVVPSFDRLAAHYGTTARAIRQANPGVREAAGVSVQVPAMHLPAAAPGSLGGTGRAGVVVRGTASPVDIRWNSDADANRIGRLSRGDQLPEIFAPTGNGFFSVLIDPGSLQQRADGIVDELRALGRVAGPGSPGNFVLGFVPAANVVETRFGQSRATQALALAYAEYQQGVSEDPPCTNRGPAVDKYTGVSGASPVIAGNRVTRGRCGLAWCAFFVRWCLKQVGVSNAIGGAAVSVKNWGQGNGWFMPTPPATPAVGDVFFKQPSGSTGHACDTNPCVSRGPGTGHVGFILGVSTGSVTTVEGNIHAPGELNDGVRSLSRPISDLEGVVRIP